MNNKDDIGDNSNILQLIAIQAKKNPDEVALVDENSSITYADLQQRFNRLASYIRHRYQKQTGQELVADTLIGFSVKRSIDMVVAMLAILQSGAAFVPLDAELPEERLHFILQDTDFPFLLRNLSPFLAVV